MSEEQTFLKESFEAIRLQALEQSFQLVRAKLGTTSDSRTVVGIMGDIRKLINITKTGDIDGK